MLRYALLGLLNYQTLSGYDLKRIMDMSTSNFWSADISQIYKTLKTLETEGAITSAVQAQDERPDRRMYTITDAGREDLHRWLMTPITETTPLKETVLLKLFFSAQIDKQHVLTQLLIQRELHRLILDKYRGQTLEDIETNAAFMGAGVEDALYWDMTRRAGELYEEMYIRWLDETIARIRQRRERHE